MNLKIVKPSKNLQELTDFEWGRLQHKPHMTKDAITFFDVKGMLYWAANMMVHLTDKRKSELKGCVIKLIEQCKEKLNNSELEAYECFQKYE